MLSLKNATACIAAMKENGTYRGHKVGFLEKDIYGTTSLLTGLPAQRHGKIVIFKDEERLPGEHKTVTVETPMSPEQIKAERARKSLITTYGCIVCVPAWMVEEIEI